MEAKSITEDLALDDRVQKLAHRNFFVTLKDHKANFRNNPSFRLISPTKSEIGIIRKQILDKINKSIVNQTGVHQWKNTRAALKWFNNIPNKQEHSFIAFDIVNFYPSITSDLLNKALDFASNYTEIAEEDKEIILHAKQSLLFHDDVPWAKKSSPNTFDVTMGSYDGAESRELVGTYLLCQLPEQIRRQVGLYRDDGLGAFRESPRHIENIKKQICKVFTNNGLRINIEANKKIVDFLDVTLDLNKGTHEPYTKPNNTPLYVHNESNHPPSITRNIPVAINKRLNEISSNKESFEKAAPLYQSAINQSGYNYQLTFEADTTSNVENKKEANNPNQPPNSKRSRQRKVTWYNPPFSKNVKTNVGRKFLNIVNESFKKGHPHK